MASRTKIARKIIVFVALAVAAVDVFEILRYHLVQDWEPVLEVSAKTLKYLGLLTTLFLSLFTLTRDTNYPPPNQKELTPDGKKYRVYLILAALITGGASALEDITSARITEKARLEGDQRLVSSIMSRVTPEFEKQNNRLGTAANSLEKLHGELNGTAKELTKRVEETGRDIGFSSAQIEHMNLALTVVGYDRAPRLSKQERALQEKADAYFKASCLGEQPTNKPHDLPKPWEPPPDDECGHAITALDSWRGVGQLLKVMDPSQHLKFIIILHFNGFRASGTPNDCEVPVGDPATYRCLEFRLDAVGLSGRSSPLVTGTPHFLTKEVGIGLQVPADGWQQVFGDRAIYGRDSDVQWIELMTCDQDAKPDLAEKHLRGFRSRLRLRFTFNGFEAGTAQPFWKSKIFAANSARISRWSPQCRTYTYYPI